MERADRRGFELADSGPGSAASPPALRWARLGYGSGTGLFSSRPLEAASRDRRVFRLVGHPPNPDPSTIRAFRKRFRKELPDCLGPGLRRALERERTKRGPGSREGPQVRARGGGAAALSGRGGRSAGGDGLDRPSGGTEAPSDGRAWSGPKRRRVTNPKARRPPREWREQATGRKTPGRAPPHEVPEGEGRLPEWTAPSTASDPTRGGGGRRLQPGPGGRRGSRGRPSLDSSKPTEAQRFLVGARGSLP